MKSHKKIFTLSGLMWALALMSFSHGLVAASASAKARERVIAEQLTERVKMGEPLWLKSSRGDFFSLYSEQAVLPDAKGAVILLHGMGAHPDWPEVISPLRTGLPEKGWATLSIQAPVLAPEDPVEFYGRTTKEAGERIRAAIHFLQEQEYEQIVIIAYSFGGASAVRYLADNNEGVTAFVGISLISQPFLIPRLPLMDELSKLKLPVLDVYGSRDRTVTIDEAADRRLAARKAENPMFRQIEIHGADQSYIGLEDELMKRIRAWLDKLIAELALKPDNEEEQ